MHFLIVLAMLTVSSAALCNKLQVSADVVSRLPVLHRLIYTGQRAEFSRLLPEMSDYIDDQDAEGRTPLHWAVYADDFNSTQELLHRGADPNKLNNQDRTPLQEAALLGNNNNFINILIANGGDPNLVSPKNTWNALFWAAYGGSAEVLQTLMAHVDPRSKTARGDSIFLPLAQGDDPARAEKVKILLDAGVIPDIGLALLVVPLREFEALAQQLKSYGNSIEFDTSNINIINAKGGTPLMKAAFIGSVTAAQMLIEHGADLNHQDANGFNALFAPYTTEGHHAVAKLLLTHGIEVDGKGGRVAFFAALRNNDIELATLLLEKVTARDPANNPVPANWLIGEDQVKVLDVVQDEMRELLLTYGADQINTDSAKTALTGQEDSADMQKWATPKGMPNFLINFNMLAAQGRFKPLIGREQEMKQVITALARKDKSNAMLIGEAGVGKTAIVEGLAQRIVAGEVPPVMRDKIILGLDVGELLSNTIARGMVEERIQDLLYFLTEKFNDKAVLFIDEAHQLISSPTAQGAADLLKTALARGELHCIAATTQDEFQKHIMRDSALERRFMPVTVNEPSVDETIAIIDGLKQIYEQHHGFSISDAAVQGAVKLADQYITNRLNPDKAIDALDMAAANVAVSGEQIEELGYAHIAEVLSEMSGVPVERMLMSKQDKVTQLLPALRQHIFGQDKVLEKITQHLTPTLVGASNPDRPVSMYLQGPSGVGKTETAKVLAEHFFGASDNLISINLSEYRERHAVESLIGSPSGYIGYDQGGILTEAVRKKPFSVVLFDEIGEAHPDFFGILLKILDEGELTDRRGRTVNFRNTIIVITSNTEKKGSGKVGFRTGNEEAPNPAKMGEVKLKDKEEGRLGKIFVYDPLPREVMGQLIDKELTRFNVQLEQNNISVSLTSSLHKHLREKGYSTELGARALQKLFEELVESPLAMKIAAGELEGGQHYRIGLRNGNTTVTAK